MTRNKINLLLKALNSKPTGYRSGWVLAPCVLAPWRHANGVDAHPSFAISETSKKKSICKCLSCGFGGDLMDLLFMVSGMQKKHPALGYEMKVASSLVSSETDDYELSLDSIPDYGDEKKKVEFPFPESWLESFKSAALFQDSMAYLHGRGVTDQEIKDLEIKYDPLQKRIGFPFRNFKGKLMGVQGRSIEQNPALRYYQYGYQSHRNLHCWGNENRIDFDKPLILCEGPFDLARIYKFNRNVAMSFTSGLSVEKIKRMADASEIITLYDHGAGGDSARKRIKEVLKSVPVVHLIPTAAQDDAGNMSDHELRDILGAYVTLEE